MQDCPYGCKSMPAGTSDKCEDAPTSGCPFGNGAYCGGPVGKDGSTLYWCSNGSWSVAAGCYEAPAGTSDACKGGSCPFGNGAYCGQTGGLSSSTLYDCSNGAWKLKQSCSGTCVVAPPGQADYCP